MFIKTNRNKKMLAAVITSLVLTGALTGCGQKSDETATETVSQTSETIATAETTEAAKADAETGVAADTNGGESEASEKNKVFGEFKSMTLDGEEVDQEIFGTVDLTMVNLWGTFCGYCIEEMPYLGELHRQYQDQGFQIVGILTDVTEPNHEEAVNIVETTKADYTHILLSDSIYPLVAGVPVPTTIFLDKDGNPVGKAYAGAKDKASWEALIKDALEQVK